MKLQKFVKILNHKPTMEELKIAGEFFKKYGKNIFSNNYILLALLEEKWSKQKRSKLLSLSWIIEMEIRREYRKEKTYFKNMLPLYRYFEDYMSEGCAFFGNWRVPFEEWEDLAKEQTDILKILIERNQLKSFRRTKIFFDFLKKCDKRTELLIEKKYLNEEELADPMGRA